MRIPKLKVDKSLPHHYLIGIAVEDAKSKNAGQFYLKYGPVYYHNNDVAKVATAVSRCTDKIYEQTQLEAIKVEGCEDLVLSISAMRLSCAANSCTMHHFSSADKFDDDYFVTLVEASNNSKSTRQKIKDARI